MMAALIAAKAGQRHANRAWRVFMHTWILGEDKANIKRNGTAEPGSWLRAQDALPREERKSVLGRGGDPQDRREHHARK